MHLNQFFKISICLFLLGTLHDSTRLRIIKHYSNSLTNRSIAWTCTVNPYYTERSSVCYIFIFTNARFSRKKWCLGLFITLSTNDLPIFSMLSAYCSYCRHSLVGYILYNGRLYINGCMSLKKPWRLAMKSWASWGVFSPKQPILSSKRKVPMAEI